MEIKNAIFYKTIMDLDSMKDSTLTEIGLSGRSNVGKSSFINAITNNSKLARTSKTPGKTITLNFYLINNSFYFVDMPGYGFASREKDMLYNFSDKTNKYIENSPNLKGFIMIVDSRIVTQDDKDMKDYLVSRNMPFFVLLSKIDKLKRNDIRKRIKETAKELEIDETKIVPYSSYTHESEEKVLYNIEELINF